MTAIAGLLDARDASLARAISLARDLATEIERYDALTGEIGMCVATMIGDELRMEHLKLAVVADG